MVPAASRVIMEPTTLQMASVFEPLDFGFALGGDGVGGFAGLRDHQRDGVRTDDGIAVAPFTGVIDLDRERAPGFRS